MVDTYKEKVKGQLQDWKGKQIKFGNKWKLCNRFEESRDLNCNFNTIMTSGLDEHRIREEWRP